LFGNVTFQNYFRTGKIRKSIW